MAETALLACGLHDLTRFGSSSLGVCFDLGLVSVPALHQLLACSKVIRVISYHRCLSAW